MIPQLEHHGTGPGRSVETLVIDFHTHSSASDGAISPEDLIARVAREGIQHFALTDHDTINGYLAVRDQVPPGLTLVSGVELSCQWARMGIHIVGLGFDPEAENIVRHLGKLDAARLDRAERIAERLAKSGMPGALAGAQSVARGAQIGRPHFARWMVLAGYVDSEEMAFKRFLGRGKPGDISVLWPSLEVPVRAIKDAGGVAVLAHPLDYKMTATKLRALVAAFAEAGGDAVELINGKPKPGDIAILWRLADAHHLDVSVGSDFHRDTPYGAALGVNTAEIPPGRGVWERL